MLSGGPEPVEIWGLCRGDTADLGEGARREMGGKGQQAPLRCQSTPTDSQTTTKATVTARAPGLPVSVLGVVVLLGSAP